MTEDQARQRFVAGEGDVTVVHRPDSDGAKGRQDGDYEPPILAEPKGGPIPPYTPPGESGGTGKTA